MSRPMALDKRYSPKSLEIFWKVFGHSKSNGADILVSFENARLVAQTIEEFTKFNSGVKNG